MTKIWDDFGKKFGSLNQNPDADSFWTDFILRTYVQPFRITMIESGSLVISHIIREGVKRRLTPPMLVVTPEVSPGPQC